MLICMIYFLLASVKQFINNAMGDSVIVCEVSFVRAWALNSECVPV